MQVKKFEARTMKEALEMVKVQLGPDAIILSARDNKKSFGLVGEGSVEITAAVSDETLQKKRFVEARLREQDKEKMGRSSARVQKQVIDKMVGRYLEDKEQKNRQITQQRYIDIDDGMQQHQQAHVQSEERIRNAVQAAWSSFQSQQIGHEIQPSSRPQTPVQTHQSQAPAQEAAEVRALKGEIESLRKMISQFQTMPQSIVGQHPGADYRLSFDVSGMFQKLTEAGVSQEIAAEILTQAEAEMPPVKLKNKALVDGWVARYILNTTNVVSNKIPGKFQIFMGPAGSGKTTTLVKMASHLVVNEGKKVAMITADTFKVGAADQLKIYAQILNVPFALIRDKSDWERIIAQLSSYDHILVDFPGFGLKNMDEISKIRSLIPNNFKDLQSHLVLSCMAKDNDLTEIGRRYKVAQYTDVIFTSIDESTQHGNIYNFSRRFETPIHSFGLGSRVPEDFEMATKERVLDLIFKITRLKKEQAV